MSRLGKKLFYLVEKKNHFNATNASKYGQQKQKHAPKTKKSLNYVGYSSSDNEEYLFAMDVEDVKSMELNRIHAIMNILNKPVKFQVNCGSNVNVLSAKDYRKLFNDKDSNNFRPRRKLFLCITRAK